MRVSPGPDVSIAEELAKAILHPVQEVHVGEKWILHQCQSVCIVLPMNQELTEGMILAIPGGKIKQNLPCMAGDQGFVVRGTQQGTSEHPRNTFRVFTHVPSPERRRPIY